jgi:trehalose/maltose hydrolase-like predicted phosphorylase
MPPEMTSLATLLALATAAAAAPWTAARPPPVHAPTATSFQPPEYLAAPYLTNGFFGIRPQPIPFLSSSDQHSETLVAGYETKSTSPSSPPYGQETPVLSPAPFPLETAVSVNGVALDPWSVRVLRQTLNMSTAELTTTLVYNVPKADETHVNITCVQFLSRSMPVVALQRFTLSASRGGLNISVRSNLSAAGVPGILDPSSHPHVGNAQQGAKLPNVSLAMRSSSGSTVGMAVSTRETILSPTVTQVDSYASVVSSVYFPRGVESKAIGMSSAAVYRGYDALQAENRRAWAELWESRVVLSGPGVSAGDQQLLDFGASRHDNYIRCGAPLCLRNLF